MPRNRVSRSSWVGGLAATTTTASYMPWRLFSTRSGTSWISTGAPPASAPATWRADSAPTRGGTVALSPAEGVRDRFEPGALGRVGEQEPAEPGPVELTVGLDPPRAELRDDRDVPG